MAKVHGIRERIHQPILAGPLKVTIEHDGVGGLGAYDPYPFERSGTPQIWGEGLTHDFDASLDASEKSGASIEIGNFVMEGVLGDDGGSAPASMLTYALTGAALGVGAVYGKNHVEKRSPQQVHKRDALKWGVVGAIAGIFLRGVTA